ncbi:glycosyl hydrolase family 65 protein [Paludisphaera borealis]|uniref:Glycoside hydrolase family 65 C-terminal domain-containing protein n=1 Tax=Paludisphaera borealis TaxID=1387353 RepID=A0A1U7CUX9_9BACT|nr:glycosyl hydrolase family 65 protein [Paludisphaera borealis]APW62683.1 hypothetical protein BSF38_04233 [Paludisphaera borealis]
MKFPSRIVALSLFALAASATAGEPPQPRDDFPQFIVPGQEAPMARLQELFRLHHDGAFTGTTLWDAWLPHATLWAATGEKPAAEPARSKYRGVFLARPIDAEGYISMQQHRGLAHSEGWPFPTFQQAGGVGWYFSTADEAYGVGLYQLKPLTNTDGWEIEGAEVAGFSPDRGLDLRVNADVVTVTTPPFTCATLSAPFIRLEWAARGLGEDAKPSVSWLLNGEKEWRTERHAAFDRLSDSAGLRFANIPLYKQAGYDGTLTRLKFRFDQAKGATLTLKSLISAIDSRHPITNVNFIRGAAEYFSWTTDLPFLRSNIGKLREALRFALREFGVEKHHLVRVPWVGHEGTSGLAFGTDGKKTLRVGRGVGNNYWDLLPFGGDDALATIYLYDALRAFAAIEREAAAHPEWTIPADDRPFEADALVKLAEQVRARACETFWNDETGRFVGWRDRDGRAYDYGFVFVNTEAVAYGLATDAQAKRIYDWLDGRRVVAGDTSQGADIYHWRFGPRSTTRRNVETYVWAWSAPESIPWGSQVQDGGGVLGFTYFDLMARLRTLGPDDAWRRLREVIAWFGEVQAEGGYRAYYAKPGRGTLQGGGPPGGLGFDNEFMESVLVPQVMLYGFLGVEPRPGGLRLNPRLPSDWPSLTVTRIHAQGHVLDVAAFPDEVRLTARVADGSEFLLWPPDGRWRIADAASAETGPLKLRFRPGRTIICRRVKD